MDEDRKAEGLKNFVKVLSEAGFHLRSGDSPNILSNSLHILHYNSQVANNISQLFLFLADVPSSVFQLALREHLSGNDQDRVDRLVSQCEIFFNTPENFIKALHSTKVCHLTSSLLVKLYCQ